MGKPADSVRVMFVFLRGHSVLEYYFNIRDVQSAANDAPRMTNAERMLIPQGVRSPQPLGAVYPIRDGALRFLRP
jgi:hypothetical protein